jgi:hypothetical protein
MSVFLVVTKKKVIDVPADPGAVPPVVEVSHLEVDQVYIEVSAEQVTRNLEAIADNPDPDGADADYYNIQHNGAQLQTTIHPTQLKATPRAPGPALEIAEIEANGQDVGSAIVEV